MRKYIYIGCGGFAGAILRYVIEQIRIQHYQGGFPINTLFINISGTFLLALIMTIAFEIWVMDADIRIGITTGFFGAYTTFSTFCKEAVVLMQNGDYVTTVSYLIVSPLLGLGVAYLGVALTRKIGALRTRKPEASQEEVFETTETSPSNVPEESQAPIENEGEVE